MFLNSSNINLFLMLIDGPVLNRDSETEKEKPKHTPLHYVVSMIWKGIVGGLIIWLISRLIMKGLARPTSHHHLKPINLGLCVFYIVVLIVVLLALMYSACMDCRKTYEALTNWISTSPSTNHQRPVIQQV